jgi:hypothetical protein
MPISRLACVAATRARQATAPRHRPSRAPAARRDPEGNELLTSVTGALLLGMLAVIGVTIIALGPLLWVHLFVGLALVGPLVLKMASTGYRFTRYYLRDTAYRAKGAPQTPLRVIAPMVILSTIAVMASGVALLFEGPSSRDALLPIHKISFFVWAAFTAVHVLAHLPGVARALRLDIVRRASARLPGQRPRGMVLAGAMIAGVALALLLIPEYGPWLAAHMHRGR